MAYANFYKGIYEMLSEDRPDNETIDNDSELDKYLEELNRRHAEGRLKSKR